MRLAKIIATLGPASEDPQMIRSLIQAGVNIVRLNFSHGEHDKLVRVIQHVRQISQELDHPVGILGDLQGPKIRVGEFEEHRPIFLEKDTTIRFSSVSGPGNPTLITTNTPQIVEELNVNDDILLNDGLLKLRMIERVSSEEVVCQVIIGGMLGERKGINVPQLKMANLVSLTEKDKADARFALTQNLDFLALSFVRSYQDIFQLRRFIEEHLPVGQLSPLIIAKIEKPQALDEIDAIIQTADGIMVARGDLGVELSPEKVPVVQKMIINKANEAEKPVITATQILESMIHSATPTRAEVSDVANAVFDGSDALMLSGETAMGKYPLEAVQAMGRIIKEAESHFLEWHHRLEVEAFMAETASDTELKFHQAIAQAACFAARKAKTRAIVVLSFSGRMARRIAKRKPQRPIIALTPQETVLRQLTLLWGVYPLKVNTFETAGETLLAAEQAILDHELLKRQDPIVLCAGQTHLPEITNTIKIYHLGDILQQHQWSAAQGAAVRPSA